MFDIDTRTSVTATQDTGASDPRWIENNQLVWLKTSDNGNTSVIVADAEVPSKSYTAGTIPGPVSNLKVRRIEQGMLAIAVSGKTNPDGSLFNPKDAAAPRSTAKLYDATFVRHWDHYVTRERNSIFTAILKKAPARVAGRSDRYNLLGFTNALKGTGLECPIPPFGGTDHFDIGNDGLVIVAKDPDLNPATHTKCNAYWIPKEDLMDMAEVKPQRLDVPGLEGAASCPVVSDSGRLAFLQMKQDGYESDKNEIVVFLDVDYKTADSKPQAQVATSLLQETWDRSPTLLTWAPGDACLYALAEDTAANCVFQLTVPPAHKFSIRQLTTQHHVNDVIPISSTSSLLLLSSNSLVHPTIYSILDVRQPPEVSIVDSLAPLPSLSSTGSCLPESTVRSLWWKGDKDHLVHALMVLPSFFDKTKKYPLAYLIHGGPQGAWSDSWSTRWNPAIFAEQGYIAICPNPTGSTGYGQAFTDAIKNNWGGSPYIDLEKGFEHIKQHLSFVDTDRAVALGASYGGYMMAWMQGHALSKHFKALVMHDGVFSMTSQLASEEQYFPMHDLGGPLWLRQQVYDKWDPSRHAAYWSTPMLIIHSEKDYRLTIAEGLSAFNVLQGKGITSRFLTFSDENHWVLGEENSLLWELIVLNWCNRFVGLAEVRDREGRNGDEYLMQRRRKLGSEK